MMRVIDSHTEGEPTRVIIEGVPPLGNGPLAERRQRFAEHFDHLRSFAINEPRGFDAMVGALLCEPTDPTCAAGVVFFNNVGYLGMCGHGTMGLAVTLAHLGRIGQGVHRIETPVGVVAVELHNRHEVTIENVPSYVYRRGVMLEVEGIGGVEGDIAWGGNWFFLTESAPYALNRKNIPQLTAAGLAIKQALAARGITGRDGQEIDHIEFLGEASAERGTVANSRNFVLCPGGEYDRSPCGTGTSAKLACLAAHGALAPDVAWVQESIIGSQFTGRYRFNSQGEVIARITGRAYVVAEATLLRDSADPFQNGIGAA